MQPNELRIGNIVYIHGQFSFDNIHFIKGQDLADMESGKIKPDFFVPVPFSKIVFERFGFILVEDDAEDETLTYSSDALRIKFDGDANYTSLVDENGNVSFAPVSIHYAHQLQNLYFVIKNAGLVFDRGS